MIDFPFSNLSDTQITDMFQCPNIDLDTKMSLKYSIPFIDVEDHEIYFVNQTFEFINL